MTKRKLYQAQTRNDLKSFRVQSQAARTAKDTQTLGVMWTSCGEGQAQSLLQRPSRLVRWSRCFEDTMEMLWAMAIVCVFPFSRWVFLNVFNCSSLSLDVSGDVKCIRWVVRSWAVIPSPDWEKCTSFQDPIPVFQLPHGTWLSHQLLETKECPT